MGLQEVTLYGVFKDTVPAIQSNNDRGTGNFADQICRDVLQTKKI